jgi:serine/threonine-protein kinase
MAADEPTSAPKPELRIGSYRLVQQLGAGGMSSVFRAIHAETGHEVAVKILPRALAKNPTLLQRFLREAKSAESLEHPNIVSIYDRGVDQGRHYLVLEYVPGGDLHERVRDNGPLPIDQALHIVRSVAEGLRYAASRGVVHRDIKPANILVAGNDVVKIIDLGLALQAENEDERVTRDGTTVGTVDYMSPEQARDSRATNERSDMYSLGCTLYFLLTGSPPYPGGNLADKLSRHCTEPAPDPRKLRPDLDDATARLVLRLMAKKPDSRFADYDKLIAAIDRLKPGPQPEAALDAIIDDDDEDESPAALTALIDDESEEGSAPLEALIDDEDDVPVMAPAASPAPSTKRPGSGIRKPPDEAPQLHSVPLAELAALDAEPRAAAPPRTVRSPTAPQPQPAAPATFSAILDEEVHAGIPGRVVRTSGHMSDEAARAWITRCIVIGIVFILLVIGIDQIIRAARSSANTEAEPAEGSEQSGASPSVRYWPVAPAPLSRTALETIPGSSLRIHT